MTATAIRCRDCDRAFVDRCEFSAHLTSVHDGHSICPSSTAGRGAGSYDPELIAGLNGRVVYPCAGCGVQFHLSLLNADQKCRHCLKESATP